MLTIFEKYCSKGKLKKAKEYLKKYPLTNISRNIEYAFRLGCANGHICVVKWLYSIKPLINISAKKEYAFRFACANGHLKIAQWLYYTKPVIDISIENNYAFRYACANGYLEIVKWLYSIKPQIKMLSKNNYAFRYACVNGHLEVAKWIYSLKKLKISTKNNWAFIKACENNQINVAQWLEGLLSDKYELIIQDNKIVDYYTNKKSFPLSNLIVKIPTNDLRCTICLEDKFTNGLQTNCFHSFCYNCIQTYYNVKKTNKEKCNLWLNIRKPEVLPHCPICQTVITKFSKIEFENIIT